jgi:hypothetical protein
MTPFRAIRAGKPAYYPDQTIYAEYAASALGLDFAERDGGTGLIFQVSGAGKRAAFGAGRGSFFPQNTATAATLANDKHMANVLMAHADIATLGGDYFFLHDRHRAHRAPGHEREDARTLFRSFGGTAFVKPLNGSRGDFAQSVSGDAAFTDYLDKVAAHYDAIIVQRVVTGQEYRIFVLDNDIVYSARKLPPVVIGDGTRSLRDLLSAHETTLSSHGISSALAKEPDTKLDTVPAEGERFALTGRMNRSAGGTMEFAEPAEAAAAFATARGALRALGLRAGAVDLFTDIDGDPSALRVIEVNANPSIRFLEDADRADLILRIWRHTFTSLGLIDV